MNNEPDWQRSSFCGGGGNNCVEIAATANDFAIRESTSPEQVVIAHRTALRALLAGVKSDKFAHLR